MDTPTVARGNEIGAGSRLAGSGVTGNRQGVRETRKKARAGAQAFVVRRPRQDSNLRTRLRRAVLYPLSYAGSGTSRTVAGDAPESRIGRAAVSLRGDPEPSLARPRGGISPGGAGVIVDVTPRQPKGNSTSWPPPHWSVRAAVVGSAASAPVSRAGSGPRRTPCA